jgi:hypothetical protein
MAYFDQDPTNALATGESHTWKITLGTAARRLPLRFTMVWTDPPGNPVVGVKLVNDLDLIVTNLDSGEIFPGNRIAASSIFSSGVTTNGTNFVLQTDYVNNVENVYLEGSVQKQLGTNYSITVVARRVNVNAVTTRPEQIVQDFALVLSSANPNLATGFTITDEGVIGDFAPHVVNVTNGVPILHNRPGANSPYLLTRDGVTNQWNFFVFTNAITNQFTGTNVTRPATNVAFTTFMPPNLSLPRVREADIDLYVSAQSGLTNLDTNVLAAAWKGLKRSGTESVIITNA